MRPVGERAEGALGLGADGGGRPRTTCSSCTGFGAAKPAAVKVFDQFGVCGPWRALVAHRVARGRISELSGDWPGAGESTSVIELGEATPGTSAGSAAVMVTMASAHGRMLAGVDATSVYMQADENELAFGGSPVSRLTVAPW